jgi:hypothetical protein
MAGRECWDKFKKPKITCSLIPADPVTCSRLIRTKNENHSATIKNVCNMTRNNYLGKSFGPVGSSAGVILFVVGVFASWSSLLALVLVVAGVFMGFTSTRCIIDLHGKKVMLSNNLFGIVPSGKWMKITPEMKIGIRRSKQVWRTYSRSNRQVDVEKSDFRVFLYDSSERQLLPLKKAGTFEAANRDLHELSKYLGLKNI